MLSAQFNISLYTAPLYTEQHRKMPWWPNLLSKFSNSSLNLMEIEKVMEKEGREVQYRIYRLVE